MNLPTSPLSSNHDETQTAAALTNARAFDRFIALLERNQLKIAIAGGDLMLAMVSYWVAVNLFRDIRGQLWSLEVL